MAWIKYCPSDKMILRNRISHLPSLLFTDEFGVELYVLTCIDLDPMLREH